jgi:NADH-quinone oxidoreductase subunit L
MTSELLWLIVALPFAGSLLLAIAGKHLRRPAVAIIGVGSVALSALVMLFMGLDFIHANPAGAPFQQTLWQWINVSGFSPGITLHLDSVSLIFVFVITFVGALIHLYSAPFMWKDEGFARFFSYMNLFVGFMLLLVLADNFLLLYLGWEGVGLCSYLLIGFWHKDPANGYAARKAFTVTRVGDTAMVVGLFILFSNYHTLDIQDILNAAPHTWTPGSTIAITTAFLLLGGAVGKSAQVPLQTWLPDAMAAPSPVSALIHAATMVTAGVYLIARTHVLFELAPVVQNAVALIGAITLMVAGMAALYQHDIKKVLAYSTISQIGYMFVALGVGAWSAALFHFMIHAFFKSLLFLGAGTVIAVLHDEHNMYKMGGLWKKMPVVFWTFLIGACALSALPLITAGFYSKDEIIWQAYASDKGSITLWLTGLAGAFITALYTFRMVFLTFFGKAKAEPAYRPGIGMTLPLVVLAFLSFAGGFIQLPDNMGHVTLLSHFIEQVLPATATPASGHAAEWIAQLIASIVSIAGLVIAYKLYYNKSFPAAEPVRNPIQQFFFKGWNFDLLYDKVIVQPIVFFSRIDKKDIIDQFYTGLASIAGLFNKGLAATQNGKLRWYAMALVIGAVITLTILFYT